MRQDPLSELLPILSAPWQQRRCAGSLWVLLVIVGLLALVPVGLFAWSLMAHTAAVAAEVRHAAGNAGACVLAVLTLCAWAVTVSNLLDQNRPVLARLVPAHPARLRMALVVAAALATAFITLVLGVRFEVPLACGAVTVVTLAFIAAALRWPALWLMGCVSPFAVDQWMHWSGRPQAVESVQDVWSAQPVTSFVTLAAMATVLLALLVQNGGVRHVAADASRRRRTERMQLRWRGGQPVAVGTRGRLDTLMTQPYYAWYRHVLSRSASPVFSRVMLALGPGAHWTASVAAVACSAVVLFGALLALEAIGICFPEAANFGPDLLASFSVGIVVGLMSPAMQIHARLHQSRREQSLVALLPGVPRGAVLSRRLAWQLTGQFLLAWAGSVALMALCLATARALRPEAVRPVLLDLGWVLAVAALPMVGLQWRPWARVGAPTTSGALVPFMLLVLVAAVSWGAPLTGWISHTGVTSASVIATVAWCAMRWRRMASEPSALPVGRLA